LKKGPAIDLAGLDRLRARLAGRPRLGLRLDGYRPASVLVPLWLATDAEPRMILIVRRADLRAHAGQIALPGGGREDSDADATATALREAREELGIPPDSATVLGLLDDVPTPTRYVITPVVAVLSGPLELEPAPAEVAEVLVAPLDELRHPERYRTGGQTTFLGVTYTMHEYHWEERRIWGATARILHQFFHLLDE
jgi:8-oxo-dGTP pyrophosphatase MutT (NUDIX family)